MTVLNELEKYFTNLTDVEESIDTLRAIANYGAEAQRVVNHYDSRSLADQAAEDLYRTKDRFVEMLRDTETIDKEDFATAVGFAVNHYGVPTVKFMDEFKVKRGTVSRWCKGKNATHTMNRTRVLEWIANELER